ncbi:MAG: sulfatase [Planctomycetota bacterium]
MSNSCHETSRYEVLLILVAVTIVVLGVGGAWAERVVGGDGVGEAGGAGGRPNVVVIVADDLGWRDPGFMGSDYHRTPRLDGLAAEGVVFRQAYANAAVCAPTRAAILTGMYASRTGVYTVGGGRRGGGDQDSGERALVTPTNRSTLASEVVTLPEALRAAGYVTGHVGKWHLGRPTGPSGPTGHGFDSSVGASRGGGTRSYFAPYGIASLDGADTPKGEYLTDRLTDEAIAFVEEHRERPFFLWLAHYAVHTPIEADPGVLANVKDWPKGQLHDNAAYAAMIASLDRGVGRLLDTLERLGLAEDTIVVFVSDNGGGRRVTSMAPLSGFKGSLEEGGLRVPCVVRWPGKITAGLISEEPVLLFDLYPTLLDLAGVDAPVGQAVDGVSWGPLLRGGEGLERRDLVWYVPVYTVGPSGRVRAAPRAALRYGDWKLVYDFESERSRLFDLSKDVGERDDRADAERAVVAMLEKRLQAWLIETGDEVPRRRYCLG